MWVCSASSTCAGVSILSMSLILCAISFCFHPKNRINTVPQAVFHQCHFLSAKANPPMLFTYYVIIQGAGFQIISITVSVGEGRGGSLGVK